MLLGSITSDRIANNKITSKQTYYNILMSFDVNQLQFFKAQTLYFKISFYARYCSYLISKDSYHC